METVVEMSVIERAARAGLSIREGVCIALGAAAALTLVQVALALENGTWFFAAANAVIAFYIWTRLPEPAALAE